MSTLMQTRQLDIRCGGKTLLGGLDLQIQPGQCWVVLGRNGAGKTSLLKTLAGLLPASGGEIMLDDRPIGRLPPKQRAQRLGLVFQHSDPGFHTSTLEMALSGGYARRGHWAWENAGEVLQAQQALAEVRLADLQQQSLESLSGGELRRAEIARLLVQAPALAMLDEPLNHLDIGQQIAMLQVLRRHFVASDRALLLVLHDINLARRIASHALLMYGDGHWRAGPVQQVADIHTLSDLLGYPLQQFDSDSGPMASIDFSHAGF